MKIPSSPSSGSPKIPRLMQAVVYHGINDLRLESLPVPRIGPREMLVKVAACGVCPTDIKKIHFGTVPPPRIFGHETSGTIAKTGALVRGFRVGDRVALHHHVPCLDCHACRHHAYAQCPTYKKTGITAGYEPAGGGYAEYVRVMSFVFPGVVKIPRPNSFIEGAMLEPVNTVLKAIYKMNPLPGDAIWVAGQGPIGLLFTRLLALRNVSVLASDRIPERLRLAKQFGARWAVPADRPDFVEFADRISKRRGLDGVILAVPADPLIETARQCLRGGGRILLFAHTRGGATIHLDPSSVCVDEKDLIGSYSSDITLQPEVARLVFSRQIPVDRLVSHRFALAEAPQAIELAAHPMPRSLKIMVQQTSPRSA